MERSDNGNEQFKCTGKEQDAETDFNYFGARYYDAGVSVWLSVDPLNDERLWVSPYNYVQWNPLGRIDRTGNLDTDYGVKENGEIILLGPINDEPDRLFAVDDNGKKKSEDHVVMPKGSLSNINSAVVLDIKGVPHNVFYVFVKGDYLAEDIFHFLTENTKVEYSRTAVGEKNGEDGMNIISTSLDPATEFGAAAIVDYIVNNHYQFIRIFDHSHPNNTPDPSPGDKDAAKKLYVLNSNVIVRIYLPKHRQYSYFDEKGYYYIGKKLKTFKIN